MLNGPFKAKFMKRQLLKSGMAIFLAVLLPLFLPLTARAQNNCTPAPSGLIAWWPGDGFTLDVAGTNNGKLQNGAGYAAGEVGQSFSFNGVNQYLATSFAGMTNIKNTFTMEFWAYPTASLAVTAQGNSGISGTCCQRYAIFPN